MAQLLDKDIREPLFDFLEMSFGKVRIFEEKRMGNSRADLVMVTPAAIVGIEIKSDADTYARLSRQVRDYDTYYDRNYLVAGTRHAAHVEEHVPAHWGIITVELEGGQPDFYLLRRAKENPHLDWQKKLGILWRPELAHIQEQNGMCKYAGNSKAFVVGKILERVPPERLQPQICEELFERDYENIHETINAYRTEHGKKPRRRTKKRKRSYKAG